MNNSIPSNLNPVSSSSHSPVLPKPVTRENINVKQVFQEMFPTAPLVPPTHLGSIKGTLIDKFAAPGNLPRLEQRNAQLATKGGRDALVQEWNHLSVAEKKAWAQAALSDGYRDLAVFCLRPGMGITPYNVFNTLEGLAEKLSTGQISSQCIRFLFRHPSLDDQGRTEIAARLISSHRNIQALMPCLESLNHLNLLFRGETIFETAENIPQASNYGDWELDDESLTMRHEAFRVLKRVISEPRFAAQAGITSPETEEQYLNQF